MIFNVFFSKPIQYLGLTEHFAKLGRWLSGKVRENNENDQKVLFASQIGQTIKINSMFVLVKVVPYLQTIRLKS